jgi:hypothetical protein
MKHLLYGLVALLSYVATAQTLYDQTAETRFGYTPVRKGDWWGVIDSTGKTIAECKYRTAQVVGLDCDMPGLLLNGDYCFIRPNQVVCYQQLYGFVNGVAKAMKNNLYGFVDKNGTEVLPFVYRYIDEQKKCGLNRVVTKDDKMGFISTNPPKIVIPAEYTSLYSYNSKVFSLCKDKYCGVIDSTGKTIIPFLYSKVQEFSPTSFLVTQYDTITKTSTVGICNYQHQFLLPMEYATANINIYSNQTFLILSKTGKYGAMNKELQTIVPFEYQSLYQNPGKAQLVGMKENKYGYLDLKGNVLAPCEYDTKIEWRNKWYEITQKNKKYGVVDTNYHTILPFEYDYLWFTNDTLLTYKQNQLYGLMHLNGTQILAPMYESIGIWQNNFCVRKKGIYAVIDQTGKEIIPFSKSYNYIEPPIKGVIKVTKNGVDNSMLYGYINDEGKELVPIKYHELSPYNKTMVVTLNGKKGIIDDENKVIMPLMYDSIQKNKINNDDYCLVYLNKKCGIMNSKYQLITPIVYDTVLVDVNSYEIFRYKRTIVVKDGKKGIIDEKGSEIVPPILAYDNILPRPDGKFDTNNGGKYRCGCTSCNLIGGRWGLLDTDGSLLIAAKYRYAIKSIGNVFQVTPIDTTRLLENDTYGWGGLSSKPVVDTIQLLIDKNETVLGIYNKIYPFRGNSAMVTKNGKLGAVDSTGHLTIPLVLDYLNENLEYEHRNYPCHVVSQNGKWGILDSNAQWLIEPQYSNIKVDKKYGVAKNIPVLYYNVSKLLDRCEKQQAENGKWGVVNLRTKAVVPAIYDKISSFSEGLFKVYIGKTATEEDRKKGKWGIVDSLGNEVVPPICKSIEQPYLGFIKFQDNNGLFGLMNMAGKQIIPPIYDEIKIDQPKKRIYATKNAIQTTYNFKGQQLKTP